MALFSMFIAYSVAAVMAIGFILLIIGIILTLKRRKQKKAGEKPGFIRGVVANLSLVGGVIMFVIPLIGIMCYEAYQSIKFHKAISSFPEKVKVEYEWQYEDGFVAGGKTYEVVEGLNVSNTDDKEKFAALIYGHNEYIPVYVLPNDMDIEMYVCNSRVFVCDKDVDKVQNYYSNDADYTYRIAYGDGGSNWKYIDVEFDYETFDRIYSLSDADAELIEYSDKDVSVSFSLEATSSDRVSWKNISVNIVDGAFVVHNVTKGGTIKGVVVSGVDSEKIGEVIATTDILK